MRAAKRKRERVRTFTHPPEGVILDDVAQKVVYVGSCEYKNTPSFAGQPRPRADASICDASYRDKQSGLTEVLKECIRNGSVGAPWEGCFPRYVWGQLDGQYYEARLVNKELGEYKGYPLDEDEMPRGIKGDD